VPATTSENGCRVACRSIFWPEIDMGTAKSFLEFGGTHQRQNVRNDH
jgi:hypothetical protein